MVVLDLGFPRLIMGLEEVADLVLRVALERVPQQGKVETEQHL